MIEDTTMNRVHDRNMYHLLTADDYLNFYEKYRLTRLGIVYQ